MARKKTQPVDPVAAPRKSKNPGRDRGELSLLGFEVESALKAGIDEAARREERTKKVILQKALRAYLRATGVIDEHDQIIPPADSK